MATIQSIHDVLMTYQQVYGAEALQTQLSLFLKNASSPAPSAPSVEKRAASESPSDSPSDSPLSKLSNQELRDIWAELTGRTKGLKSSGKLAKKADLIAEIERLRSAAPAAPASVASSEEPAAEEKKEKSKRSGPSAWNAFVKSVAGEKGSPTAEFLAWKAEHKEEKGNLAFSYAKSLGKEVLEAFKSSYVPSASSSVVSDQDEQASVPSAAPSEVSAGSKKKAGRPKMSDEERAAKAEAKKAAKMAERQEKKAAKKAEKAAAKAAKKTALPALPESEDEEESETVFTEVEIGDEPFFWNEKTGSLWARGDDGSLSEVGTYDGITISFS